MAPRKSTVGAASDGADRGLVTPGGAADRRGGVLTRGQEPSDAVRPHGGQPNAPDGGAAPRGAARHGRLARERAGAGGGRLPGKNGKIAFVSDGQIWTMSEEGTGRKQLTTDGGEMPAW
jgi:hypothetical protein